MSASCTCFRHSEQSFGLQAELNRGGRNPARCIRVVLEDLKPLAEGSCRGLDLTKHHARAHKAGPSLDISRCTLKASCKALDHGPDCVRLALRRGIGRGLLLGAGLVPGLAAALRYLGSL